MATIAAWFHDRNVPTVRGGQTWRVSSVQAAAGYLRPPTAGSGRTCARVRPKPYGQS
jgi:hypothetical protein